MIETINAMLFGIACSSALLLATYIGYTALRYGWQEVGDTFDRVADKIWHISNVYEGEA